SVVFSASTTGTPATPRGGLHRGCPEQSKRRDQESNFVCLVAYKIGGGMRKPDRVLDRDTEWSTLVEFVAHPDPHLRLAVVSGRRRVGKSYLLRALADVTGGLYVSAVAEEGAVAARRRFAADI